MTVTTGAGPASGGPRKWRLLATFWAAQGGFVYLGWPLLACNEVGELVHLPRIWLDSHVAPWAVLGVALLMAGQAAFVLPVRAPRAGGGRSFPRALRHGAAGLAAGSMAALLAGLLVAIAPAGAGGVPERHAWAIVWSVFGATTLVVAGALWARYRDGTPVGVSIAIAGFASAALLAGIAAALIELWERVVAAEADGAVWAMAVLGATVAGWGVSTPLLLAFVRRGPRKTRLERVASRLFLGSMIEAVAVLPLDVVVRRRTTCYCGEGTFWSLVFCGSVGLLMLGPAVFFLLGRRRERWLAGRCEVCDYDMSGCSDAARCPECGAGWRRDQR